MNKTCYCCANTELIEIEYINPEYHGEVNSEIFDNRQCYFCGNCGFSFSWPFMEEQLVAKFYSESYPIRSGTIPETIPTFEFGPSLTSKLFEAKNYISEEEGNFLDFGAGIGASFYHMKQITPKSLNYYAIEAKESIYYNILKKQGINILPPEDAYGRVNDKKFHNFFDVIFTSHTLEHFNADKLEIILCNLRNLLKSSGILIVAVPKDDFSNYAYQNIPKVNEGPHLSHFTKKSLELLFTRNKYKVAFLGEFGPPREFFDGSYETYLKNWTNPELGKKAIKSIIKKIPGAIALNSSRHKFKRKLRSISIGTYQTGSKPNTYTKNTNLIDFLSDSAFWPTNKGGELRGHFKKNE